MKYLYAMMDKQTRFSIAAFTAIYAPTSVTTTIPYSYHYSYTETGSVGSFFTTTEHWFVTGFGVATSTSTAPLYEVFTNPSVSPPYACSNLQMTSAVYFCGINIVEILWLPIMLLSVLTVYLIVGRVRRREHDELQERAKVD